MMSERLQRAFEDEMRLGYEKVSQGDRANAFRHFERAHVLGQRHTIAHVRSHWAMLGVGWADRDAREILGQVARIPAALLFSRVWVPVGNTGGANVSAFKPLPIVSDLAAVMDETPSPPT